MLIVHRFMLRLVVNNINVDKGEIMEKEFCLYMHTGCGNHGCEAIVRSVSEILGKKIVLYTKSISEDEKYLKSPNIIFKETGNVPALGTIAGLITRIKMKGLGKQYAYVKPAYKNLFKNVYSNTVALSIGGDNYCYDGMPKVLEIINVYLNKKGAKTVLYGCSIEPDLLKDVAIVEDLKRYSLIVARESITYNALVKAGLKSKTILASDPAFTLETKENEDAEEIIGSNTVGINLSPLVLEDGNAILFDAYCRLLEWILEETDMRIVLIPHVIWNGNDDRVPLKNLYDLYKDSNRVLMIGDHNAIELKGYISKCRFFVGARTHATIAAYSSRVPTLVAGYSVKSKGIARDIFGTEEGYVVDSKNIRSDQQFVEAFAWLYNNEDIVRSQLVSKMPEYIQNAYAAVEIIKTL